MVRDAEIERYIKSFSTPIWHAAGLDPASVQIHLVNNNSLNAFVAGGQRIFVFSGLLLAARDPNEVIGVLAHETGHITGGHLARFQDGLKGASTITIISMLLGAAQYLSETRNFDGSVVVIFQPAEEGGGGGNRPGENGLPTGGGVPSDVRHNSGLDPNMDVAEGDAANLEYSRKATDMVIDYLKDLESRPNPELLKELGWTPEEMKQFP